MTGPSCDLQALICCLSVHPVPRHQHMTQGDGALDRPSKHLNAAQVRVRTRVHTNARLAPAVQHTVLSCQHQLARQHLEMGTTARVSSPVCGLYDFCLTRPGSMTYTTPSRVMLVSATLVATMMRRQPSGGGMKTSA